MTDSKANAGPGANTPAAQPNTNAPAATTPPALTPEQVLDALDVQLDALDIPNMDSESARKWLKDFRVPLASMTVNGLVGLLHARAHGTSDAALQASLMKLTPAELNQVMKANLAALDKIKDERVREVALMRAAQEKLTSVAASYAMSALLGVLGVPVVTAMTAPATKPA